MQQTVFHHDSSLELPATRQVELGAPLEWLEAGWRDFRRTPLVSGFYGLVFVLLGYAVTAASWQSPILVMTFITGFFLITPFLTLGLYHLSRQHEQGHEVRLVPSLLAFRHNKFDMGLLVVFHAVVMIAWIRLATLIGAIYVSNTGTSIAMLSEQLLRNGEGAVLIGLFMVTGGLLAGLVFITSVVSWPMLLDRRTGVINAVVTSIKVVRENKGIMLVWAALIVSLLSIGIATFYLGLLVIIPILGHATWHAYRDLVK